VTASTAWTASRGPCTSRYATLDVLSNAGFDGSLSVDLEGTQEEFDCLPRIVSYPKGR
jgi:hypothetical protein